jgi:hypothetical protein
MGGYKLLNEYEGMRFILSAHSDTAREIFMDGDENVARRLICRIEKAAGEHDVESWDSGGRGVSIDC